MSSILSRSKTTKTISAVITRADGRVEDLGEISYSSPNPFKTAFWYLRHPKQLQHKITKRWNALVHHEEKNL